MKQVDIYRIRTHGTVRHYLGAAYPGVYLTLREINVIQMLSLGVNRDIAMHLGISKRTLESYIEVIRRKLGCRNKKQLIVFAMVTGLLNQITLSLADKEDE
tara:strand:+ start:1511 stop:1813 length:303 start_codon:yes stop_codon:yes gene_type:complete